MDADADRPAALPQVLPAARGPVTVRSGGAAVADAETVVLAAYEAYARDLNAFARSLVREREAAEDIVAEAYLRLVREAQPAARPTTSAAGCTGSPPTWSCRAAAGSPSLAGSSPTSSIAAPASRPRPATFGWTSSPACATRSSPSRPTRESRS